MLFILAGAIGLLVTKLGWMDPGGLMRRMDWFGFYKVLDHKFVGGGVRRASYQMWGAFVVIGLILVVYDLLRHG